ncbi:MAG: ATP-binding cassette domain-containing protein [Chitinivibrionales bacterium]|nr:ATP-binding cassette domain-containing protein [Chitinivibrionales bacterium]
MPHAIDAHELSKNYAGEHALKDVSFTVVEGSLYGIIGADGAGKTTLLKIATTLLPPDKGSATVLGHDIGRALSPIRAAIGYMPQRFSLYEDLSVIENIHFFADLFGVRGDERRRRVERLLEFSRLAPFRKRRARDLSGGMKQKLALSCALVHTPRLLILDEPTTGVDPVSRREFWAILRELHDQGITIVVSTPYMSEAEYCSELLLLHRGRVLQYGTPSAMVERCPIRTYRISSERAALNVPQSKADLGPLGRVYAVAGALHVAVPRGSSVEQQRILEHVKSLAPEAAHIDPVQPTIEDLFFHYLTEEGGAS